MKIDCASDTISPMTEEERQASVKRETVNRPWTFHKSSENKPGAIDASKKS